jgi:hypothetical protein
VSPSVSKREYLAEVGLAGSGWSTVAAQTPFGGWNFENSRRYFMEFLGWAQFLIDPGDFWQWDVLTFDDVELDDLAKFRVVVLPSVLVITDEHVETLDRYLALGGRLIITGETGHYRGPGRFLMPRDGDCLRDLKAKYPDRIVSTANKPGIAYHETRQNGEAMSRMIRASGLSHPVLRVENAPERVGVYLNASVLSPNELTLDLVNYDYDLATDRIRPVASEDFTITMTVNHLTGASDVILEAVQFDEGETNNVSRRALTPLEFNARTGVLIVSIPPFDYYQVIRILPGER